MRKTIIVSAVVAASAFIFFFIWPKAWHINQLFTNDENKFMNMKEWNRCEYGTCDVCSGVTILNYCYGERQTYHLDPGY